MIHQDKILGDVEIFDFRVGANNNEQAPIVLTPGLGCDWGVWNRQIPWLASNRRVACISLRGRASAVPEMSLRDMASDILRVAHDLRFHRPVLIGQSLGGATCLEAGLAAPDAIAKIITFGAPPPGMPPRGGKLDEWLSTGCGFFSLGEFV